MPNDLQTREGHFGVSDPLVIAVAHPSSLGDRTPPSGKVVASPAAVVVANHGRWIAECPCVGCNGAELASRDDPRFFCAECRNAEWGHAYLPLRWPAKEAAIRDALLRRVWSETRNWRPAETVADLLAENAAHPDGVI